MTQLAHLPRRGVVEVSGADRVAFLQGLVSNDVALVRPGSAIWAALLTPQGKYLADFFILTDGETLLLDCEATQLPMLMQKLIRFRLRSAVAVADTSARWHVHAAWDGTPDLPANTIAAADPRLPAAGSRILAPGILPANADEAVWDRHRLGLGLPDGTRDLDPDKTVLLEAGFDELNGVSWTKGCYMGQELTARTKYRGLIKRRLLPVHFEGPRPPLGTGIMAADREAGTLRDGQAQMAMATLRVDALDAQLTCAGVRLTVCRPDWLVLPR